MIRAAILVVTAILVWPLPAAAKSELTLLVDDNYPPYIFRSKDGRLDGVLPDLWRLWSSKTGIEVTIRGMDWGEAQKRFAAGEGDVIDTMFRTPARERLFDFSDPYAAIDVALVFDASLTGISSIESARAYSVGVKDGDACVDRLKEGGITGIIPFPSYESMVDAAALGQIKVMCIDKPPAAHLLRLKGVAGRFHTSSPLYTGHFHWAVRKGQTETYRMIADGFAMISQSERHAIEARWLGQGLISASEALWRRNALWGASMAGLAGLLLTAWVWALRRKVRAKTAELRNALERLALSEQNVRTILDNLTDAVFIHDGDTGQILMVNQRMLEMYGCTRDEALKLGVEGFSEGASPYSRTEALEWLAKSRNAPQVFEWSARRRDGSQFWAEVAMRRAHVDSGPERVLVLVRDITERHEAQDRIASTVDALSRSNTDLERFAYAASHDLREPMNTVVRFAQLLESRYKGRMDADADEFIGFIVKSAKQMTELVDGLLDYSRVNARTERFGPVDTARTIALIKDNLNAAIAESGARITTGFLPVVQGDAIQLLQLLQNLIANSIKYRRLDVPPVIDIRCEAEGELWHFTVTDNGIGIEPEFYEQIFAIFRRLHTHSAIPGIGVGLALCKRIVERHGGLIWVQPAPSGNGAQLHFTLAR